MTPGFPRAQVDIDLDAIRHNLTLLGARAPGAQVMAEILREAREDPERAANAPYTTPVRRLDEAAAARRPVVRQPG